MPNLGHDDDDDDDGGGDVSGRTCTARVVFIAEFMAVETSFSLFVWTIISDDSVCESDDAPPLSLVSFGGI